MAEPVHPWMGVLDQRRQQGLRNAGPRAPPCHAAQYLSFHEPRGLWGAWKAKQCPDKEGIPHALALLPLGTSQRKQSERHAGHWNCHPVLVWASGTRQGDAHSHLAATLGVKEPRATRQDVAVRAPLGQLAADRVPTSSPAACPSECAHPSVICRCGSRMLHLPSWVLVGGMCAVH